MLQLFKTCFVVISLIAIVSCSQNSYRDVCSLNFEFRQECVEYFYNDICVPWNVSNCVIERISIGEHHCPIYDCSVSY
jgi:hypothetical protein